MKFFDFYEVQLGLSDDINLGLKYNAFINEYYYLFERFNNVDISKERLIDIIDKNIIQVKDNEQAEILEFSVCLKNKIICS